MEDSYRRSLREKNSTQAITKKKRLKRHEGMTTFCHSTSESKGASAERRCQIRMSIRSGDHPNKEPIE
ncbi:hypothetical protein G5I_01235 [Acromyrmex echinatior]|uniref:Uncharacterized protein n=1 Tax=Acromyrmex echinatior TaxID=103372 RepID=F4W727_ACREC|nr:hypothetical protein G5I_01235 [Acromyrmex echinatior]